LLDHPRFAPGGHETIYHDDGAYAPFATDASKFAFFCAAAAELITGLKPAPDVIHLHDWHTAFLLLLRHSNPRYRSLRSLRTVFSIHNLALQGIRPLNETDSCLTRWFPDLKVPESVIGDPRYPNCINPMAAGIRLADAVSTVSPSYAREILLPADERHGRRGGEGLQDLLAARQGEGALSGILNGCEYPEAAASRPGYKRVIRLIESELADWIAGGSLLDAGIYLADQRIAALKHRKPGVLITSVGRATEQKLGLLRTPSQSATTLDRVLDAIGDGLLIMLASGDPDYEGFLQRTMARHENFLFLKGYSDSLADVLYRAGDLFLMPSVFEPCGISQMLAMRAGQPCVAHAVGGLRDTVTGDNGFPFTGASRKAQAAALVRTVARAVELKASEPEKWQSLRRKAKRARFTWDASADHYLHDVYAVDAKPGR
jgi:starch synthase